MSAARRGREAALFFVIVLVGTGVLAGLALGAPGIFGPVTLTNPLVIFGVYLPSITSFAMTAWFEGRTGLAALLKRLNPFGFHPGWYLVVLVGMPVLIAVAMFAAGTPPEFVGVKAAVTAVALGLVLDPGPIGEEFGWRGYALPRLLDRFSPFVATVILGLLWALWHVPAFYFPGMPQSDLNLVVFFVGAVCVSMLMTWVSLSTSGSILLAILIHLMANHGGDQVGATFNQSTLGFAVATVLILAFARRRFFAKPSVPRGDPRTA